MTEVVLTRVNGSQVFIDREAHENRWADAFGPDVVKALLDFVDEPVDSSGDYEPRWTITRVETGSGESTFGPTDGHGGIGRITTDDAENDGVNAQFRAESFKLTSAAYLYFGVRMKISEATQSDYFVGLAITDTDILGGVTDRIGFEKLDGSTSVTALVEKDSTETQVTAVLTQDAAEWHTLEFYFVGPNRRVYFYVDGEETTRLASFANIPDDEDLRISVQGLAGSAAARTFDIDWIRCIEIGRAA